MANYASQLSSRYPRFLLALDEFKRAIASFAGELSARTIFWQVFTFAALFFVARIDSYIYNVVSAPAMISAVAGVAVAAVILGGYEMLVPIAAASFINGLLVGKPIGLLLGGVLATTLQAAVIVLFLATMDFNRRLSTVRDMFLLLFAGFVGAAIEPSIYGLTILAHNAFTHAALPINWNTRWLNSVTGVLLVAPFLLRWVRLPMHAHNAWEFFERILSLLFFALVTFLLYWTPYVALEQFPLIYLQIAVLLWITFRTGPRYMTLAMLLLGFISFTGILYGVHLPSAIPLAGQLLQLEVYDLIVALSFFILVSVEEQRKDSLALARQNALELERALGRLQQEEQTKNSFIASLAHELRNPLATVLSSVELIQAGPMQRHESKRLAKIMETRVKTMRRLLDDLLDVARMGRNELIIKKEAIDLMKVLRRAIETSEHHFTPKGQIFSASLPAEPVILYADPVRLEQVFVNILTNASKYTPAAGRIDLFAEVHEDAVLVRIIDTGVGIPPTMLDRIFEPFVQIKHHGNVPDGLGIGLSIVKSLVELHGGHIVARSSSEGQGTEFVISLPLPAEGTLPAAPALERSTVAASVEPLKIVIVDDNASAADALAKLLTLKGHTVTALYTGSDAVTKIPRLRPDIVLLDLGLPDIHGYEVARTLRKRKNPPVLIALTGYGQPQDREKSKEAGFDHHLTKPIGLSDLTPYLKKQSKRASH